MPASRNHSILNVVVDQRFKRCPDGRIWTFTPPSYEFFAGALQVFDRIRVVARVFDVPEAPHNARLVCGPRVDLVPIPSYIGPMEYVQRHRTIHERLTACAQMDGAFLFRIPSQMAFVLAAALEKRRRPYAVELLTDPWDFFAPGVAPHGLAFLFRPYFSKRSRELCARASAVNYVTGSTTQRSNPTRAGVWSSRLSDVELPREAFLDLSKRPTPSAHSPIRIVTVGFLDLLYKGQDVLIQSVAAAKARGHLVHLTFIGDGQQKSKLAELARASGVAGQVEFAGALGGPAQVRERLANADAFSLPSRAEGIPRALLEAMAAGLPAICSHAGAMGDLLEPRWIVEPNSVEQLTSRFIDFAKSRHEWPAIGQRNQETVRDFVSDRLFPKRIEFYRAIRDAAIHASAQTTEWNHAA